MIRGFYTALSGMVDTLTRQSIVADNIANLNTPAFKQTLAGEAPWGFDIRVSTGGQLGWLGTGTYATAPTLDRTQGPLETTGLATDLAIEGDGSVAYTRAGDFVVDARGWLVTQAGQPVLDVSGRPVVPGSAAALTVGTDGTVAGSGQRLAIVGWPEGEPVRLGENLYALPGTLTLVGDPRIHQGMLERSNTDAAGAMTDLISLQRMLQLSSRALSLQDQTLGDAAALGRLRG
jgi:flagellar basal-body rod protein FlgG